jgi:hypothetical protein
MSELSKAQSQLSSSSGEKDNNDSQASIVSPPSTTAAIQPLSSSLTSFNEELYSRAILRENELLDQIKLFKSEINHLRSRLSIMNNPAISTSSSSSIQLVSQQSNSSSVHHHHYYPSSSPASSVSSKTHPEVGSSFKTAGSSSLMRSVDEEMKEGSGSMSVRAATASGIVALTQADYDGEHRLVYLKQAICSFFKAKHTVEMQHLGRVICAILGVSIEEEQQIMENIAKLAPAVVATSTIESFSQSFASIFY